MLMDSRKHSRRGRENLDTGYPIALPAVEFEVVAPVRRGVDPRRDDASMAVAISSGSTSSSPHIVLYVL